MTEEILENRSAERSPREKTRHVVCPSDELPSGSRKVVKIGRREIGVFRVGDNLYALPNVCPHHLGPLARGTLTSEITGGTDRDYQLTREGMILRCPWHQFEFDIETGRNLADGNKYRAATYTAKLEGDEAVVYI